MFRPVIPACFRVQHSAPPGLRAHSLAQSRSLRLPLALPKGRLVPAWADGCAPVGPAPSSLSCWLGIVACCTRADIFLTGKPLLQNRLLSVFRRKAFISLRRLSRRRCPGRLRAVRRAGGSVGALRFCGRYRSWRKLSRSESRPGFVRAGPHSLTDPLPCTAGSVYPLSFGRYVSDAVPPGRRAFAPPNFDPLLLLHPHSRQRLPRQFRHERTAARQASRVRVSLRRLRRGRTCGPLFLALRFCPALPPACPQSVCAAVRRRLSKTREVPCGGYGARSLRLPPPCRIARSEPGGGISADPPALPALFARPSPRLWPHSLWPKRDNCGGLGCLPKAALHRVGLGLCGYSRQRFYCAIEK